MLILLTCLEDFRKDLIPEDIHDDVQRILTDTDAYYGKERSIASDDGGYILIADSTEDIAEIEKRYFNLSSFPKEQSAVIGAWKRYDYLLSNECMVSVYSPL